VAFEGGPGVQLLQHEIGHWVDSPHRGRKGPDDGQKDREHLLEHLYFFTAPGELDELEVDLVSEDEDGVAEDVREPSVDADRGIRSGEAVVRGI
jgi:hypothetical protein